MKYWLQVLAEIMTVWSDENEVDAAEPGENVKLKLKNVEEDVSNFHMRSNPGFCCSGLLIKCFSYIKGIIIYL